jgi:hypothetical protein
MLITHLFYTKYAWSFMTLEFSQDVHIQNLKDEVKPQKEGTQLMEELLETCKEVSGGTSSSREKK